MVNIHIWWTPKQAWPWQGWEQPFGYSGKSQPEARIPFNKYLWRLPSAKSHQVQFCHGAKVLLTKGASGKGKEEGQEPGWLLRTWSHVEA